MLLYLHCGEETAHRTTQLFFLSCFCSLALSHNPLLLGIRTLGVPELTVNKHLKETQTFSFGAAMAYDHGLKESKDALAGALYRNVFSNQQERNNPHLEQTVLAMSSYVQDQVAHLNTNISDEDVLIGALHWRSTPGAGMAATTRPFLEEQDDEWREATADSGDVYYWNPRTRETKWK